MIYRSRVFGVPVAAALLFGLSACVPIVGHYYETKSEYGNSTSGPGCGPNKSWRFHLDGEVSVEVSPWYEGIGLAFFVPEQFTVQMQTNELMVWRGSNEEPQRVPIWQFTQIKPAERGPDAIVKWDSPLIGGTRSRLFPGMIPNVIYTVTLRPSPGLWDGDVFRIAIPPFLLNGQRYELPIVLFTKSTRFWITPINC